MEKIKLQPFLVRLRPTTRAVLDAAAADQRRSRASIIDQAVMEFIGHRYQPSLTDRLDKLTQNERHT